MVLMLDRAGDVVVVVMSLSCNPQLNEAEEIQTRDPKALPRDFGSRHGKVDIVRSPLLPSLPGFSRRFGCES